MYRLAVCEDEINQSEDLCARLCKILTVLEQKYEIVPFYSAEELEKSLSQGERFNLICLDILLTGKTGMDLALELRQHDEQTSILFISSSTQFLLEGYGARPIQYLLKPVKQEDLQRAIETDLRLHHTPQTLTLRTGGKTAVLPLPDIRYVESWNHGCIFHMPHGDPFFSLSLAQAEALIPKEQFCRCHNSFLINMAHVRELNKRRLFLTGAVEIPIGRRYAESFQTEFVHYLNRPTPV